MKARDGSLHERQLSRLLLSSFFVPVVSLARSKRSCHRRQSGAAAANAVAYLPSGCAQVVFDFVEKRYPEIQTFSVEGAKSLPQSVVDEVRSFCAWHWYRGLYLLC